jgi:hypothetical protein
MRHEVDCCIVNNSSIRICVIALNHLHWSWLLWNSTKRFMTTNMRYLADCFILIHYSMRICAIVLYQLYWFWLLWNSTIGSWRKICVNEPNDFSEPQRFILNSYWPLFDIMTVDSTTSTSIVALQLIIMLYLCIAKLLLQKISRICFCMAEGDAYVFCIIAMPIIYWICDKFTMPIFVCDAIFFSFC